MTDIYDNNNPSEKEASLKSSDQLNLFGKADATPAKTLTTKSQRALKTMIKAESIRELIDLDARQGKQDLAFLNRVLTQVTLPHSELKTKDPNNPRKKIPVYEYEASDGNVNLLVESLKVFDGKNGWYRPGLPYGAIPRLIMAYINTWVVQRKDRKVIFGDSLSEFMKELGIIPSWGENGRAHYVTEQLVRLLSCRFSVGRDNGYGRSESSSAQVVKDREDKVLWWDAKTPDQMTLEPSYVVLDEAFYQMMLKNPIPLHMDVLRSIKNSAMAIDLYAWLSYRTHPSRLDKPLVLKWQYLQKQFGSGYSDKDNFVRAFKAQAPKMLSAWEMPPFQYVRGGLKLLPTESPVKPKIERLMTGYQKR